MLLGIFSYYSVSRGRAEDIENMHTEEEEMEQITSIILSLREKHCYNCDVYDSLVIYTYVNRP